MSKHRLTDTEYAALADSYEAHPPTADEIIGPVEVDPARLRTGRPAKGDERGSKTPSTTVRLPEEIRAELTTRADDEAVSAGELVRRALIEYFGNHPKVS